MNERFQNMKLKRKLNLVQNNNISTMLTEKEVTEYQEIHKKIYWTEISRDEALTSGISLITFMETVLKSKKEQ